MFFDTYNRLLRVGDYYTTNARAITAGEVTRIIRRQFPATDFLFITDRNSGADPNMIIVSGTYDSDHDVLGLPSVEITLSYHPAQDSYNTKNINWTQLSFDLAECAAHELIHREQHQSGRRYKRYRGDTEDQTYLGDESEIDAYGFSIAADSVVSGRDFRTCAMYQVYQNTFDTDQSVIVKLEKQIIKYLRRLEPSDEQNSNRYCARI
jgi:hypothetical protein